MVYIIFIEKKECIQESLDLLLVFEGHLLKAEIIKKFEQTRDLRYIYQNKVDKACFEHYELWRF